MMKDATKVNRRSDAVQAQREAAIRAHPKVDRGPIAQAFVPGRDAATPRRPKAPPARGDVVRGGRAGKQFRDSLSRQGVLSGSTNNAGRRILMSPAPTGTGSVPWRSTRAYRVGRAIERRRAQRWLRNVAQGPSRRLYS